MWSRRAPVRGGALERGATLIGRRVVLRALTSSDFAAWREVRRHNVDWLTKWEPSRVPGSPDAVEDRQAFVARCAARARETQLGIGHGFGIFVDGYFAGEINVNAIQRGPFQNAYVGYWIDQRLAGQGYMPESVVAVLQFCFEQLLLHRVQISVIPRNASSRRVAEKLAIRDEGVAQRYLEINGVWEDHIRYAITVEEWQERRDELLTAWIW